MTQKASKSLFDSSVCHGCASSTCGAQRWVGRALLFDACWLAWLWAEDLQGLQDKNLTLSWSHRLEEVCLCLCVSVFVCVCWGCKRIGLAVSARDSQTYRLLQHNDPAVPHPAAPEDSDSASPIRGQTTTGGTLNRLTSSLILSGLLFTSLHVQSVIYSPISWHVIHEILLREIFIFNFRPYRLWF